jgi:type I restriction enzyme S subunit
MDTLLPKIRFKKFKNNWSTDKIENIFTINAGGDIDKDNFSKEKNKNFKYPVYANSHLNEGLYGYSDIFKQEANLITVTGRGSIGKPEVRYTKFYPIIRLLILKPKREINLEFFKNLIYKTNFYIESTGVPQLTAPQISKYKLNFPCLEEQQKIASFLTSVDDKINLLTKKKELLEQYKKGVMQKIFSQEIRFKDDNGNDFPDWTQKQLSDLVNFKNGKGHEKNIIEEGQFLVVNSKFISSNGNIKKYCNEQIVELTIGNIVMVMSDVPNGKALAKCFIIDANNLYTLNQRICSIEPLNTDSTFLYYVLNRNSFYLKFDSGVGQTNLKKQDVLNCPISLPVIKEQQKIAEFLSSLDKKIELVNSQIDKTKEFKKGLLQQMFV